MDKEIDRKIQELELSRNIALKKISEHENIIQVFEAKNALINDFIDVLRGLKKESLSKNNEL